MTINTKKFKLTSQFKFEILRFPFFCQDKIFMSRLKKIILKKFYVKNDPVHPWIYKNYLAKINPGINSGDVVDIITHDRRYLGTGYYNPDSVIAIRILSTEEENIDKNFIAERISQAIGKRDEIRKISNAFRVVSSEADGLPGLIVDLYNDTAVVQINTLGMDRLRDEIISSISEIIQPAYIFEKSDANVRRLEGLTQTAGWHGAEGKERVAIQEEKVKLIVDIVHGHKTGFYLDQRKARMAVGDFAKGKRVLDVFCYTGGFTVHALVNKATEVVCVDLKDQWLDLVKLNAGINNVSGSLRCIKGTAFNFLDYLISRNELFDMIILDPPSFLKSRHDLKTAIKGYLDLNRRGMKLLKEKGVLCTFSCSHHMRNEIFSDIIKKAAELEDKNISILKRCRQDKDHPVVAHIPETEYLKGYFLSVSINE